MLINHPPTENVDTPNGPAPSWRNWFVAVWNICSALTLSGTTAQRPTRFLWVGRPYFDTTLGYPVWVQSLTPTVWADATGAPA
jgi:hypothetical protein